MAIGVGFDENGNPLDDGQYDQNGAAPVDPTAPKETFGRGPGFDPNGPFVDPGFDDPGPTGTGAWTAPSPQPSASQPQFGQGDANQLPAPDPNQMASAGGQQTADTPGEGHSWATPMDVDGGMKSVLANLFANDPTAPGGQYSGGAGRRANPLRESNVGKQLMSAARGNTAYGNAGNKESLIGGGLKPQNFGQDEATATTEEPSDLLLQMLQLLGQPQQ